MIWYICFFAAIAVALVSIIISIYLATGKCKGGKRLSVLRVLFAGCFITGVIVCIPPFDALYSSQGIGCLKTIVLSFQKAIRVFGADSLYDVVFDTIYCTPDWMSDAYIALALAVQFFAPLLTFSFLLSFFKNALAYIRYSLSYFRDVYIFSELNNKSLTLAKDIAANHKRARIVFTHVFEKNDEEISELAEKAREIGAICFRKNVAAANLGFHSDKSKMYFFAIGDDEVENVTHSLRLIDNYNTRQNARLYIFSSSVEGELLLSAKEKGDMIVRRVDKVRSLISRTLYEEGVRIFDSALNIDDSSEKQISAVVVGMGKHGTEMLKSLAWYCQMDGYHVRINAFDKDKLAEEKFAALCPELMSADYNGVCIPGEAEYTIVIHSGCDVESKKFADQISLIRDATYVFISLGSDEMNIQTAADLRMRFERIGAKPIIHAVISNSEIKDALKGAHNNDKQTYDIDFIGDIEASYSEKVIIDSDAEEDAFARHKSYCINSPEKIEDFWRYEYCYRSTMATTVHAVARIGCNIPGAAKEEKDLTDSERAVIGALEHRRWNAYMRSEGYVYTVLRMQAAETFSQRRIIILYRILPYRMMLNRYQAELQAKCNCCIFV